MNDRQSPQAMSDGNQRLHDELELLKAMYQDSVTFVPTRSELIFKSSEDAGAQLVLRIPGGYPSRGKPQVISACDTSKEDVRTGLVAFIKELEEGEEILDALVQKFNEAMETKVQDPEALKKRESLQPQASKTVVIWLHHLLATSKRKLALHPSSSPTLISGITKPGYPGVMVFSGPRIVVDEHVSELKGLNWQAFQIRYEEHNLWNLNKGDPHRIVEVETMAEVVQHIEDSRREDFLKAVGVK